MRKIGLIAIALLLIVGTSAFAGGRGQRADGYRVAVAMTPLTNPFHITMFRFIEEAIAEARVTHPNIHFTIYHSASTEAQINTMDIIHAARYDGVIISTFDGAIMAGPAEMIHRSGTRVVVINRALETQEWDAFVSGDNVGGGENIARYMGNFLGGQGTVYIMGMALGTPIAHERSVGFREVMAREFPGITILGESEAEHNIAAGFNTMQNVLAAHPHIDAVFSHDPFSAMGQEQAIQNAGRTDVRLIMSVGPDQTVARHMRANPDTIFRGNVSYPPSMAADGIRTMIALLEGRAIPRVDLRPAELLLIGDIDHWESLVPDPDAM